MYLEYSMEFLKAARKEYSKTAGHKANIKISILFLYMSNKNWKFKFIIASKNDILRDALQVCVQACTLRTIKHCREKLSWPK